jgi:ketosteroid isomerase-like protein
MTRLWLMLALLLAGPVLADVRSPTGAAEGRKLLGEWLRAQNAGDFDAYAKLYAKKFAGVRRSGERVVKLDYAGWLADRRRMFKKTMVVSIDALEIKPVGSAWVAQFQQTFSSGSYQDAGPKRMRLVPETGELRIASEQMLQSMVAVQETDSSRWWCAAVRTQPLPIKWRAASLPSSIGRASSFR